MAEPENLGLGDVAGDSDGSDGDGGGSRSQSPKPWSQRIQKSSHTSRKIRGGNYVQIATVDENGMPRCRTVVFRGFATISSQPGQRAMKMITDARSEKVSHVQRSSACELVWWIPLSSEQYRVFGDLQLVGAEADGELQDARRDMWTKLSDPAREQFWWDQPGVSYNGKPNPPTGGRGTDGEILPPPDTFLLVLLWPKQVKYLCLKNNYAQVDTLDVDSGQWKAERVNP